MVIAGSALLGCGGADVTEGVGEAREAQGDHNGLGVAALGHNAITANKAALRVLTSFPLVSSTFDGTNPSVEATYHAEDPTSNMSDQLSGPIAEEAMRYIVECTLSKTQSFTHAGVTYTGDLGLCGPASAAGNWGALAPTGECLQLVSGCLMARTNALGKRVYLSLRGQPSALFPLGPSVPTQKYLEENAAIPSFTACTALTLGVGRTCGWTPKSVGQCTPGALVTVGAGANAANCAAPLGSAGFLPGNKMLRVCRGVTGCDPTYTGTLPDEGMIASNDDACGGSNPSVTFTCPLSGTYSVMIAPYRSDGVINGTEVVSANAGVYPSSELQTFTLREGGWFGSIFEPSGLGAGLGTHMTPNHTLVDSTAAPPVIFKDMHGCYSDTWTDSAAQLTSRMCLTSSAMCAIDVIGACADKCAVLDGPEVVGDGDYHGCSDVWQWPVTTFVNHP
jgi:hypothetical protein